MEKTTKIKINKEQELYVIPSGKGFSCLGFDVVIRRIKALSNELNISYDNLVRGTIKTYNIYLKVLEIARTKHRLTGWRSKSELYSPFIGNEGKRVEVQYKDGTNERFYIGKSTGFIPCHLTIKKSNSTGGGAVLNDFIESFKFL